MAEKKSPLVPGFTAAALGAGATKAVISDLPKGTIEKVLEDAIGLGMRRKKISPAFRLRNVGAGIKGRGFGRTVGGVGVGALTFPVFLSGVKDIKEGSDSGKTRGMAKILVSGVIYSGGKGAAEYSIERRMSGKKVSGKQLRSIAGKAFKARAIPGLAAAALTAGTIGYGLKQKKSDREVVGMAAAAGAIAGAGKQLPETLMYQRKGPAGKLSSYTKVLRKPKSWVPRVAARGAAGALGAGILGLITARALRKKD